MSDLLHNLSRWADDQEATVAITRTRSGDKWKASASFLNPNGCTWIGPAVAGTLEDTVTRLWEAITNDDGEGVAA